MAYSELIKDFERIRDYMRQFYVYGFKNRDEYDQKSARSYDNERRRMESWLGDYMGFHREAGGKNVFISVDSRNIPRNPLYNALKAKSFTAGDITFHFYVMDLLADGASLTVREIVDTLTDAYSSHFENAAPIDESSIRKKLKEYVALGVLKSEKRGRELVYSRNEGNVDLAGWADALNFFAEEHPLGVVGSQLEDKLDSVPDSFRFKHHYMLHALNSQVLAVILDAIFRRRRVELTVKSARRKTAEKAHTIFPVRIYSSCQSGRQYLLGYHYRFRKMVFFRLDSIRSVKAGEFEPDSLRFEGYYEKFRQHLWGVSTGEDYSMDHLEMILRVQDDEHYIVDRLQREKRYGTVEQIGDHSWRFSADVYDASEMLPWIRTFIGRIEKLECSNPYVTETFQSDLDAMLALYGGETHALS